MGDVTESIGEGLGNLGESLISDVLGLPDEDELTEALEAQNELQRESAEQAKQAKLDAEAARKKSLLRESQERQKTDLRRRRLRAGNPLLSGTSGGFNVSGGDQLGAGPAKAGRT